MRLIPSVTVALTPPTSVRRRIRKSVAGSAAQTRQRRHAMRTAGTPQLRQGDGTHHVQVAVLSNVRCAPDHLNARREPRCGWLTQRWRADRRCTDRTGGRFPARDTTSRAPWWSHHMRRQGERRRLRIQASGLAASRTRGRAAASKLHRRRSNCRSSRRGAPRVCHPRARPPNVQHRGLSSLARSR